MAAKSINLSHLYNDALEKITNLSKIYNYIEKKAIHANLDNSGNKGNYNLNELIEKTDKLLKYFNAEKDNKEQRIGSIDLINDILKYNIDVNALRDKKAKHELSLCLISFRFLFALLEVEKAIHDFNKKIIARILSAMI